MRILILLWCSVIALAQPVLRLKIPPVLPGSTATADRAAAAVETPVLSGVGHFIVQFTDPPSASTRAALTAQGVVVLQDVPDNALLIAVRNNVQLDGLGARYASAIDPFSKISPLMEEAGAHLQYIVEFHPDVDMNAARAILLGTGLELRENPDLGPQRLMVRWQARFRASDPLRTVAGRDEVAYIFPASRELMAGTPMIRCMSAVTEAGGLGQYIATMGNGWDGAGLNATTLAYVFSAAGTKLTAASARAEIIRAMQTWSQVVKITWTQGTAATAPRTVNVLFGKGRHGDSFPFDGPGNVLAHTFYPAAPNPEPIAGDMHLDDDETWRIGANIDVYSVALHELGHALGLGHSDDPKAVMYPYYKMVSALGTDDVKAIQTMYVSGVAPPAPPPPAPAPTPTPAPAPKPSAPPPPAPRDLTPPTLTITSPVTTVVTTTAASRTILGTAFDAAGLAQIRWSTNFGKSGVARGTRDWSADVPLLVGNNTITVRATDLAGNTSWKSVVVIRK